MLNYLGKLFGKAPSASRDVEEKGVADFELEGQNESGYVFVSRSGQKGRARMSREGDIMFLSMEDPDDLDSLSAEDRKILASDFFFRKEDVAIFEESLKAEAAEVLESPEAPEVLVDMCSKIDVDTGEVTRVSLDQPEEDVKYAGMDDKFVAEMACADVAPSVGKKIEVIASSAVESYAVPSVNGRHEDMLCDLLVNSIAKNFSALADMEQARAVKIVHSFLDVYLDGSRELSPQEVCGVAAFARLFPLISSMSGVVRQLGHNPKEYNHKHLFIPCGEALRKSFEYARPDEGYEVCCRRMDSIMEEYVSALESVAQQHSVPEAV